MLNTSKISKSYNGSTTLESDKGYMSIHQPKTTSRTRAMTVPLTQKKKMTKWTPRRMASAPSKMFILLISIFILPAINASEVDPPTVCETCFLLAKELQYASSRIHTYYESDFIDATEGICNNFMHYKIHKDKSGVHRFAKHESETMKTLKELKDRGVKVELGMPYEMWDQPAAEVSLLKQKCEQIMADYDDELAEWFTSKSKTPLMTFLCKQRVVKSAEASCLSESHLEL